MRRGAALLRQASGAASSSSAPASVHAASRAFAAQAAPAAAPAAAKLEQLRERLAAGPDFNAFISGGALATKDGYSVQAPPLKARPAAALPPCALRTTAPPRRRRALPPRVRARRCAGAAPPRNPDARATCCRVAPRHRRASPSPRG
jgi:hypothetical protein